MTARRFAALCLPIVIAAAALALLFQGAQAAPRSSQIIFAAVNGSGGTCQQSNPCSLSTASIGANNGDTVYVAQGTYTSTNGAVIYVSRSITLFGGWSGNPSGAPVRDPAKYVTTLDGQNQRRGLYVSPVVTPTIEGFVFRNGNATGQVGSCTATSAGGCGGGMYVDHAAARILNNQFISNTAFISNNNLVEGHGGGLFVEWGNGAIISGNTFMSNSAALPYGQITGAGGGLEVTGVNAVSFLVENNLFTGNTAAWGGGLSLQQFEYGQFQGNLFQNNRSSIEGAGLYAWESAAGISGNTLRANQGEEPVLLGYFSGPFNNNLVVDNAGAVGVRLFDGTVLGNPLVYNNILAHNGSQGLLASGFISFPLTAYLINNTVVGNGGGSGLALADGALTVTAYNNLFSGFSTGVVVSAPASTTAALYYTLLDPNIAAAGNAAFSHTVTGAPAFMDPANRNYHLQFNSAARDAGTTTLVGNDFDGDPRPLGAGTDIGADETRFNSGVFLALARR